MSTAIVVVSLIELMLLPSGGAVNELNPPH
jgi:hypothetical protein